MERMTELQMYHRAAIGIYLAGFLAMLVIALVR
jgi:hypothetical protein